MERDKDSELRRKGVEHQAKGLGKQVEGKVEEVSGAIRGDTSDEFKGKVKKNIGKAQRKIGEGMQDAADDDERLD